MPHKYPDLATAKKVNIDYPLSAAQAFITLPLSSGKKFRFWYVSGKAVEPDMSKPLWILEDARKIKVRNPFLSEENTSGN